MSAAAVVVVTAVVRVVTAPVCICVCCGVCVFASLLDVMLTTSTSLGLGRAQSPFQVLLGQQACCAVRVVVLVVC